MGRRQLQISSDRMIADGDNGYDVFVDIETSSGKRNMFETLYQLATALENDQPVGSFIDDIGMALDSVLETRTTIGARINALDDQERVNDGVKLILQTHLSDEADLDYNEAITRLNQQSLVLQAAQQTYTEVKGLSLFNYL
jgi:flagellar hook-associated protein 3 FlgL